jgi:hypothetical protein
MGSARDKSGLRERRPIPSRRARDEAVLVAVRRVRRREQLEERDTVSISTIPGSPRFNSGVRM